MNHLKNAYLAVDLGASSGKIAAARFDGRQLLFLDSKNFENRPVRLPHGLYWDVFGLYHAIIDGLSSFAASGINACSMGIATWGASYGLLDAAGRLMNPIFHYRDERTADIMEPLYQKMSRREMFNITGCQCNRTYTLPHLYASVSENDSSLEAAHKLLFLPDLFTYFLGGEPVNERTIAGTSSLLNAQQNEWESKVFERFNIPWHITTKLVNAGEKKGVLFPHISRETGIGMPTLAASIGHDSAAGVAAIPDFSSNKLYISIGTNISMGIERDEPLLGEEAYASGIKNTGGIDGKIIVYRDFSAFWMLTELQKDWHNEGVDVSFSALEKQASKARSCGSLLGLEHPMLNDPSGSMLMKMSRFLKAFKQPIPATIGEWVLCVLESMVVQAMHVARTMRHASRTPLNEVVVINGGARNSLLVQMLCDALQLPLRAGMPNATIAGNLLTQLRMEKEVSSLKQMREVSANTFKMKRYAPRNNERWEDLLYQAIMCEIIH